MPPAEKAGAEVILRLGERSATWGRADVVQEVTRLIMGVDAESTREQVESLTDRVLRHAEVVSLAGPLPAEAPASLRRRDGMAAAERHGAVRFSTRTTLRREAAVLEAVAAGRDAQLGIVSEEIADRVLSTSVLGEDQCSAVHGLLLGGEAVALLVGPAGTGKSRAIDAARLAWEAAGYDPIGLAPSAMAASVLSEEAGLSSETLAKFLVEAGSPSSARRLDHRSVVILDETGMARSDDLAKLVSVARQAKAKLVLVGDPHQLGAVGPGGIFRTLVSDHGAHELETVRRFDHAWEAAASLRLRARDPRILQVYLRHGRITDGSRAQMIDEAFRTWRDAREAGSSILLMAGDNATADELAQRCRSELVQRGWVGRDGVRIAIGLAGYGDEVVTLHNDRKLRSERGDFVRNGARWQVIGTSKDGSMRVVSSENGGRLTLPPEYVREHVALGYALTLHKAQGHTTERALVLVDKRTTAAQFYVAMSRGRKENRALVVSSDDSPEDHVTRPSIEAVELLTRVMRHDEVDRSAHDEMRRNLARYEDIALLNDLYEEARRQITQAAGPDHRKEITVLEPRANVQEATERVHEGGTGIHREEQRRAQTEARVAEVEREPMRARLPGRVGDEARKKSNLDRRNADWALKEARRREDQARRDYQEALCHLHDAENASKRIATLRDAQRRRESWMLDHPDEVKWARDLRERIDARTLERSGFATREDLGIQSGNVPDECWPPRLPRLRQPDGASPEPRDVDRTTRPTLDPANEAVLRRSRATTAPESWRSPPARKGHVLER